MLNNSMMLQLVSSPIILWSLFVVMNASSRPKKLNNIQDNAVSLIDTAFTILKIHSLYHWHTVAVESILSVFHKAMTSTTKRDKGLSAICLNLHIFPVALGAQLSLFIKRHTDRLICFINYPNVGE